eukprot:TRINITY_DN15750_c0_g1_i1.p1 TRINITY_DN15750_c0_g1~~TRINITY_DN15750_c0_g1_i1.p1  ORF type:complete len:1099 (+),score=247.40 TRINITY_DN15750_c0_g1_i1:491-3298(+)
MDKLGKEVQARLKEVTRVAKEVETLARETHSRAAEYEAREKHAAGRGVAREEELRREILETAAEHTRITVSEATAATVRKQDELADEQRRVMPTIDAAEEQLRQLRDRAARLEATLEQSEQAVMESLKRQVTSTEATAAGKLETMRSELTSQLEQLKQQQTAEIARTTRELELLSHEIEQVNAAVTSLDSKHRGIGDVREKYKDLQQRIEEAERSLAETRGQVHATLLRGTETDAKWQAFDQSLTELRQVVQQSDTQSAARVKDIERQVVQQAKETQAKIDAAEREASERRRADEQRREDKDLLRQQATDVQIASVVTLAKRAEQLAKDAAEGYEAREALKVAEAARAQIDRLTESAKQKQVQVDELKDATDQLRRDVQRASQQTQNVQEQFVREEESLRQEVSACRRDYAAALERVRADTQQAASALRRELDTRCDAALKIDAMLDELRLKQQQTSQELKGLRLVVDEFDAARQHSEGTAPRFSATAMQTVNETLADLQSQLQDLRARQREASTQGVRVPSEDVVNGLRTAVQNLGHRIDETQNSILSLSRFEAAIAECEGRLDTTEDRCRKLMSELADFATLRAKQQEQLSKIDKEVRRVSDDVVARCEELQRRFEQQVAAGPGLGPAFAPASPLVPSPAATADKRRDTRATAPRLEAATEDGKQSQSDSTDTDRGSKRPHRYRTVVPAGSTTTGASSLPDNCTDEPDDERSSCNSLRSSDEAPHAALPPRIATVPLPFPSGVLDEAQGQQYASVARMLFTAGQRKPRPRQNPAGGETPTRMILSAKAAEEEAANSEEEEVNLMRSLREDANRIRQEFQQLGATPANDAPGVETQSADGDHSEPFSHGAYSSSPSRSVAEDDEDMELIKQIKLQRRTLREELGISTASLAGSTAPSDAGDTEDVLMAVARANYGMYELFQALDECDDGGRPRT